MQTGAVRLLVVVVVVTAPCLSPSRADNTGRLLTALKLADNVYVGIQKARAARTSLTPPAVNGSAVQVSDAPQWKASADPVCIGDLGCFAMAAPWVSRARPLMEMNTPAQINTKFFLYTRRAPEPIVLPLQPMGSQGQSTFNGSLWTTVVCHGFQGGVNTSWLQDLKDALLERVDTNVIAVHWGDGARDTYMQAVANTRIVGAQLHRLLATLKETERLSLDRLHLIGFSLGAHIVAYAAKPYGGRVARITALDPAQPAFEGEDSVVRLNASDAQFVDVVHTNGVPLEPFVGLGMTRPVGHVDFYVNGGGTQPGCLRPKFRPHVNVFKMSSEFLVGGFACSHTRAAEVFAEAVRSDCRFWGHKTSSIASLLTQASLGYLGIKATHGECGLGACVPIGLDTPGYPGRGVLFIGTNIKKPFCPDAAGRDGQDLDVLLAHGFPVNTTLLYSPPRKLPARPPPPGRDSGVETTLEIKWQPAPTQDPDPEGSSPRPRQ